MKYSYRILLFTATVLLVVSCRSRKNFVYLQGATEGTKNDNVENYETTVQPDDILQITVSSQNAEAAEPFNQKLEGNIGAGGANVTLRGYLVDKAGNIEMPFLGVLKVGGLKRSELTEFLKNKMKPYLIDPVLIIRVLNFKVSVLGEVTRPGQISVRGDRITLLEALAESGDITVQGLRKNILIVRDNQGQKEFARVDITSSDFVNSPFYYLKQNDVVYVEPRRAKYDATALGPYLSSTASILSLFLTITLLIVRF